MSVFKNLIYVVGCDHRLQRNRLCPIEPTPAQAVQLGKFETEIERLGNVHHFDLYCEEVDEDFFTALRAEAEARQKSYENIDMPKRMRTELGIPLNLNNPLEHNLIDFRRWHELRENWMYERVAARIESSSKALVVCGEAHRANLSERFRMLGGEVVDVSLEDLTMRLGIDLDAFSITAALKELGH